MKLEEKVNENKKYFKIYMLIITVGCLGLAIPKLNYIINGSKTMLYFFIAYLCLPFFAYGFFKLLGKRNYDMKNLKEIGTKVNGEIVEIKKLKYYRSYRFSETLVVTYEDKCILVYDILENEAFRVLKILLDEYPLKKQKTIPIDVYTYKNKVYVDLESVDLSRVEGYKEALEILKDISI